MNIQKILLISGIVASTLLGCGGGAGGKSPAVTLLPQYIVFGVAPSVSVTAPGTISATASSGLAVGYSSLTAATCSVHPNSGLVTGVAPGVCTIAANQAGNAQYQAAMQATLNLTVLGNPAQTITFAAAPALGLYGSAKVAATASSALAIRYGSLTPLVCSVDALGNVTDLTAGTCSITADQAGNGVYLAAPQAMQSLLVAAWTGALTVASAPALPTATLATTASAVTVNFTGPASSGGSPVTGYTVNSVPAGLSASGAAAPLTVNCPVAGCTGYAFTVTASNAQGNSPASLAAHVVTQFAITETFFEPQTQPQNTIFTGTFALDSTTGTVTGLGGTLTESMYGPPMPTVILSNQLSAISDGAGGLLVTTFARNTTNTFTNNPAWGGTDGWTPGSGQWLYFGYPAANNGNAYVRIYVNPANPTAALTQVQLDKLAYADCTPLGMMGASCMTGTTLAGYGTVGSMSGYPSSQVITNRQP